MHLKTMNTLGVFADAVYAPVINGNFKTVNKVQRLLFTGTAS
jgi:hypothetical protein